MSRLVVRKGEELIVEGTEGNEFYVVEDGDFDIYQLREGKQVLVDNKKTGSSFGELALMYNAPRNATVKAVCDSRVRVLARVLFNRIAKAMVVEKQQRRDKYLNAVKMLNPLTIQEREQLLDAIEEVGFEDGELVVRRAEVGNAMFIVEEGGVRLKKQGQEPTVLGVGEHFGEQMLICDVNNPWKASAVGNTKLLKLSRVEVESLLGPLEVLFEKRGNFHSPVIPDVIKKMGSER